MKHFFLVVFLFSCFSSSAIAKKYDISTIQSPQMGFGGGNLPFTRTAYGHQFYVTITFEGNSGTLPVTSARWVESIPSKCTISEINQKSGDALIGQVDATVPNSIWEPGVHPIKLSANNITILKGDIACYEVDARERAAEAAVYTDSKVTEVREDMEQFIQEMRGTVDSQVRHYLSAGILTNTVTDVILREFNVMRQAVMQVLRAMREEKLYDTFLPDNQHFIGKLEYQTINEHYSVLKIEDLRLRPMVCEGREYDFAYVDTNAAQGAALAGTISAAYYNEQPIELELTPSHELALDACVVTSVKTAKRR